MNTKLWKRALCVLMSLAMLLALTACGSSSTSAEATTQEDSAAQEAASVQEEAAPAEEAASAEAAAPAELKDQYASLAGKTLKVGTTGTQKGWSQDDGNGGLEGMDIDAITTIADYYGMSIEWVIADSAGLWGMLQTGDIDTIACLTTVNEDRLDLYWFTNTYAWESYSIVSRTEDGIPEDGDLTFWAGKTISTVASGNPQLILDQIVEEQAALGNVITPLFLDSSPLLVPAVVQKESDGSLMTTSTCAYTVAELDYTDTLHIQNIQWKNMPIVYGWNRVEENKEIIQAFNAKIAEMHEDGTLSELSNKWFGMDVTGLPDGEVNYVTTTGDNAWQSYE